TGIEPATASRARPARPRAPLRPDRAARQPHPGHRLVSRPAVRARPRRGRASDRGPARWRDTVTLFGWNLVLALIWCALAGKLTTVDFTVGFVVGYAILGGLAPRPAGRRYVRRVPLVLVFAAFYGAEVVRAAMRVAWDVVTPRSRRRPAILAVPLTAET